MNKKHRVLIKPLASALDCGSEGLKSSAPSSTRFSSSSDKQEKQEQQVSHSTSHRREKLACHVAHTKKSIDTT